VQGAGHSNTPPGVSNTPAGEPRVREDSGAQELFREGSRISSPTRAKGFKEDTILAWLREAARHSEALNEVLMKDFKVKRGQLDALWIYVRNKGEKKLPRDGH